MESIGITSPSTFSSFSPSVMNNSFFDDFVAQFDAPMLNHSNNVEKNTSYPTAVAYNNQLYSIPHPSLASSMIAARPVPTMTLPSKVVKKSVVSTPSSPATVAVAPRTPAATPTPTSTAGWTNETASAKMAQVSDVVTLLKKRGEDNVLEGKDKLLYQPYRYQLVTDVHTSAFACPVQTVLYTVQVVDAETKEQVLKGAQPILQAGEGFHSMTVKGQGQFKGELRVLFLDCSYHHSNRPFALKVSYFLNNDLELPCLVRTSPAFRVIARPPDRGGVKNTKRKKPASSSSDEEDEDVCRPTKKRKTAATPDTLLPSCESFMTQFNALLESNFRPLAASDQQQAIQQMLVKLYEQSAHAFMPTQKETDEMKELANLL